MQTEARVGMVVDGGGQRPLNAGHGGLVEEGVRKYHMQQQQQTLHQRSHIGTVSQLIAGGVAGAVGKTCTAPLARLTILFQVKGMHSDIATLQKASIMQEASRVAYEEGLRAFWKGNLVTIAHRLPYSAISFYAYEQYKHILQSFHGFGRPRDHFTMDICVRLVGGGLAGITAASMTYPLDLVRTRLAAQTTVIYYRGISHTLFTVYKDEGVRGLYKGLGATLLGVGPSIAISFSVYETLKSMWQSQNPYGSDVLLSLTCGSLSGIASSTAATFPLDLVRRRMQLEGAAGRANAYRAGIFGTFRHIIESEGLRGLYRGILPEYYKVVPSVGIVFMTYEYIKSLLSSGWSLHDP